MKIIGIGNALVDVLLRLESDKTLETIGIRKGSMDLIDREKMFEIRSAQQGLARSVAPGGSVSNSMRALGELGAEIGYIGKVGDDAVGEFYETELIKAGIAPHLIKVPGETGSSTVLISPDGERSMATFLGPAATLVPDELIEEVIADYDCIYIEGYLIFNEALFRRALELGKKHGLWIALDLASYNIVEYNLDLLREVIPAYVDVLFSNESEAEAFTGQPATEAVRTIAKQVQISVVTMGKEGALVGVGEQVVSIPVSGGVAVDTTGAGDHFSAGFLYGFTRKASIAQSGQIGSLLAGHIVEVVGAKIPDHCWEQIKLKVDAILA